MPTMRAIRMQEYGGPQVLQLAEVPRPEAADGEVLVRVLAAGVNPVDWKVRAGLLRAMLPLTFPWTVGGDFSGVVERVGAGVTELKPGAEVFGRADLPRPGAYAEYVAVPRSALAACPASLDHVHAAAVPLAALTAWQSLFGGAGAPSLSLGAGQTLLILGAAGGVGSFAIQFARERDARVIALSRPDQEGHVRALGADEVIDAARLNEVGQVDAVLDLLGGELAKQAWAHLVRGGAFASTLGPPDEVEARARGARTVGVRAHTNGNQLAEIAQLIDEGKVKVVVSKTFPLASARQAHELLESGNVEGKVVLTVASAP